MWEYAVAAVTGYFVGSIPFGVLVGKLVLGEDVRDYGSGKMGATNVIRTAGVKWGILVMILDAVKGGVPVLVARAYSGEAWVWAAAATFVLIGHAWPVYVGFRGGRGVASFAGAVLALNPVWALPVVPVGAAILAVTRIMSVMSIAVAAIVGVMFTVLWLADAGSAANACFGAAGGAFIIVLHRANIERLLAGTEPKLGQGGQKRAASEQAAEAGRT